VCPLSAQRIFGQFARHVVIEADERIFTPGLAPITRGLLLHRVSVAGVVPPVVWSLTGSRDHPGHEHQHVDREPIGNQWCGERTERLTHDDKTLPVAHGVDDGVGV
jgi:hypothetical protein